MSTNYTEGDDTLGRLNSARVVMKVEPRPIEQLVTAQHVLASYATDETDLRYLLGCMGLDRRIA